MVGNEAIWQQGLTRGKRRKRVFYGELLFGKRREKVSGRKERGTTSGKGFTGGEKKRTKRNK